MKHLNLLLLSIFSLLSIVCNGQDGRSITLNNYRSEILSENEMIETTKKAIVLIQNNSYKGFKDIFALDISQNIPDEQIKNIVDKINMLFKMEGIPTDYEDIIPSLKLTINGNDSIFINQITYNYKSSKILTFSFLKKYGTQKIAGVFLNQKPSTPTNVKPTITKIENFNFNVNDITRFRIYYSEGKNKKTKYKNVTGVFAIQGDAEKLTQTGLKPIINKIFDDLKKSKFEKVEVVNTTLQRGDNPKFIQILFDLKDKPYSILIYLPLKDEGLYTGKIVLMQGEYSNLGYLFTLNKEDYSIVVKEFPKIINMKLNDFYDENP